MTLKLYKTKKAGMQFAVEKINGGTIQCDYVEVQYRKQFSMFVSKTL